MRTVMCWGRLEPGLKIMFGDLQTRKQRHESAVRTNSGQRPDWLDWPAGGNSVSRILTEFWLVAAMWRFTRLAIRQLAPVYRGLHGATQASVGLVSRCTVLWHDGCRGEEKEDFFFNNGSAVCVSVTSRFLHWVNAVNPILFHLENFALVPLQAVKILVPPRDSSMKFVLDDVEIAFLNGPCWNLRVLLQHCWCDGASRWWFTRAVG